MIPGEIRTRPTPLVLNGDRERLSLVVVNTGDRPIQVGSHLHFPDANPALRFDREAAGGFRLDIPAGTSVRLEPGVSRTVELVALGGRRHVPGLQIRDLAREPGAEERVPRPVVPFGTPGVDVPEPARASGAAMRVGDADAHDGDPAEVVPVQTPRPDTAGPDTAAGQDVAPADTEERDQ
ncbi:urease subunit beta [Nocardiopsis sp. NPDC101807]|uniref:urease subunit beta n=1 Tax=Nocardiopsis sp. NPDC101807 TaxID=3364339 RepID=UPI003817A02E